MACAHPSVSAVGYFDVCNDCGLETPSAGEDDFFGASLVSGGGSAKKSSKMTKDFNGLSSACFSDLIMDLDQDKRGEIISMYEAILTSSCPKLLRGDKRRALFAALYFWTRQRDGPACLPGHVIARFSINSKLFNVVSDVIHEAYPFTRAIVNKPVDFLHLSSQCRTDVQRTFVALRLAYVSKDRRFNNYHPQHICASAIFHTDPTAGKSLAKDYFISDISLKNMYKIVMPTLVECDGLLCLAVKTAKGWTRRHCRSCK